MIKQKPKPKRVVVDFETDEWSNEHRFIATLEGPWAKYPLSFGKSSDTECHAEEVDFAANAKGFLAARRSFAGEIDAIFEITGIAQHQFPALQKTKKLCKAGDCEYCR